EGTGIVLTVVGSGRYRVSAAGQLFPLDRRFPARPSADGSAVDDRLDGRTGRVRGAHPSAVSGTVRALSDAVLLDQLSERMGHGHRLSRSGTTPPSLSSTDPSGHGRFLQPRRDALHGQKSEPHG